MESFFRHQQHTQPNIPKQIVNTKYTTQNSQQPIIQQPNSQKPNIQQYYIFQQKNPFKDL